MVMVGANSGRALASKATRSGDLGDVLYSHDRGHAMHSGKKSSPLRVGAYTGLVKAVLVVRSVQRLPSGGCERL